MSPIDATKSSDQPTAATAPTPPDKRPHSVPPIHLKVLDLSHPGTVRFFAHSTAPYELLHHSVSTVLSSLYPSSVDCGPPAVRSVTIHLRGFDGVAFTTGSQKDDMHKEVHCNNSYFGGVAGDKARVNQEIQGVLVHELVHAFQWNGQGTADGGVIEGIADWVRLKAGLGPPHWRMGGDKWNQGYDTTAFFLEWTSRYLSLPLLVPHLNAALKDNKWDDGKLLKKLLGGEDVDQLWKVYKKQIEDGTAADSDPPRPIPTHGPLPK